MKKLFGIVLALLIAFSVSPSFAASATVTNRTILKIGTQNGNAYFSVSPALTITGGCLFDIIYIIDLSTAASKAYYATMLTAYSQGKPLSRIDYANSSNGGQCFLSLVEVS